MPLRRNTLNYNHAASRKTQILPADPREPFAAQAATAPGLRPRIPARRIIGKPRDHADAVATLRSLSGRTHRVITGVTLRSRDKRRTFDSQTDVCFDALSDEQIDYYLETYRPYDKAGAYGIQEWIGYVAIRRIEGSFYNVMGLPVQKLYGELERFIEA